MNTIGMGRRHDISKWFRAKYIQQHEFPLDKFWSTVPDRKYCTEIAKILFCLGVTLNAGNFNLTSPRIPMQGSPHVISLLPHAFPTSGR